MMVKINKWFLGVLAVSMALVVGMQSCGEEPIKRHRRQLKRVCN